MHGTRRIVRVAHGAQDAGRAALAGWQLWPPVRLWAMFTRRFGYRGIALTLFALAFVGIGLGTPYSPPAPPELLYSLIPIWVRVVVWIGCGVVAFVGAVSRRDEWQSWGFAVLLIPLLGERLLSYVGAVLVEDNTMRWAAGGFVWFLFTGIVTLIAAWPEPTIEGISTSPPIVPPGV
jgi:hypothetical protein